MFLLSCLVLLTLLSHFENTNKSQEMENDNFSLFVLKNKTIYFQRE